MSSRFSAVFGAGFMSALAFGAMGSPQQWQMLAFCTGAGVALVFVIDQKVNQSKHTEGGDDR